MSPPTAKMISMAAMVCCACASASVHSAPTAQANPKAKAALPHLVYVLADDFGHYDVGYNGASSPWRRVAMAACTALHCTAPRVRGRGATAVMIWGLSQALATAGTGNSKITFGLLKLNILLGTVCRFSGLVTEQAARAVSLGWPAMAKASAAVGHVLAPPI